MIQNKRDSLEQFIRAQMVGPGACNNRFDYINCEEGDGACVDVINTTPGSLYSTAVLFPKRIISVNNSLNNDNQVEQENSIVNNSDDEDDSNTVADTEEKTGMLSQSDEDDLYSLSQRFPNAIGISCCLDLQNKELKSDDLQITITGKYYTKIEKDQINFILVKVDEKYSEFETFFTRYKNLLSEFFSLKHNGITINRDFQKEYTNVKQILLGIDHELCDEIAKENDGSFDPNYEVILVKHRYFKSYKEKLWAGLKRFKDNVYLAEKERSHIIERIRKVELYQTFISYFEDAINICNSKSFGYWVGRDFNQTIDLSSISFDDSCRKSIYSPKKYESLRDVVSFKTNDSSCEIDASLSVWIQLTTSQSEPNKRYIKVQLENTSSPFEEDNKHYFSIVTEKVNQRCFFGVEIKIESEKLCPYKSLRSNGDVSSDIDQLNYLYRSIQDYAVGHMCSATWGIENGDKWVKTEFIPTHETPDVEPMPRDKYSEYVLSDGKYIPETLLKETKALEFKWLSHFSQATDLEIIEQLYYFIDTYGGWIEQLKLRSDGSEFAQQNISLCETDFKRMRSNVKLLLDGKSENIISFRLMNSVMFIQLWHCKNSTKEHTDYNFYSKASDFIFGDFPATWRPFQLAFILLNLDGVIQRPDDILWYSRNELVDLVWFPTGGGKTEAYLGIIALTVINRRRTEDHSVHGGTTAIMRYTLRLLATQQFQRAMRVIFALEQIRSWDRATLGDDPISIGLYVGKDSIPNLAKDLLDECKKWSNIIGDNKRTESKIPLDKCPWCDELLEFRNVNTDSNPEIEFMCSNIHCAFSDKLPIMLCDEDIYLTPPTLLFGTVDKFAMIGHSVSTDKKNKDSRRIFGGGELNKLQPSLIIQDELHLLLGPLGSAVSLFEAAIDQLCSYEKDLGNGEKIVIRPKIISSTATTRNTELQVRALYDRGVNIFPKSGIDYDDSFFAFYKREKINGEVCYISKRKYMGILPTGRTQMTTQMRLIATLFVHRALFEKANCERLSESNVAEAMDFYHSIITYFNSLKEVGKTDAQFYTEFTKYTRRLFKRVERYGNMLECFYAYDSAFVKSELTGRLSGSEVVNQLSVVSKNWHHETRLPYLNKSKNEWQRGSVPPDLILATNMISVGLDVDRFNTIVMNSMPRNIAEYIQASSRVARNKSGLVITLHNPFRARDLSHFERFIEFHEKLYYYVEPISITPFSKKAVAKYLPLYLASMIRHKYKDFADQKSASKLNEASLLEIKEDLCKYFKHRLARTQDLDAKIRDIFTEDLEHNIETVIEEALQQWLELAKKQASDKYFLLYSHADFLNKNRKQQNPEYKNLFLPLDAYEEDKSSNLWTVPMSLRSVEPEAVISVTDELSKC